MKKIILISCSATKLDYACKAEEMYSSALFKLSMKYAKTLNPTSIFILSAKYGLVPPAQIIEPYNVTLTKGKAKSGTVVLNKSDIVEWSKNVMNSLTICSDLEKDSFLFLAGKDYVEPLLNLNAIQNYCLPLLGLKIGKRLNFLKQKIN